MTGTIRIWLLSNPDIIPNVKDDDLVIASGLQGSSEPSLWVTRGRKSSIRCHRINQNPRIHTGQQSQRTASAASEENGWEETVIIKLPIPQGAWQRWTSEQPRGFRISRIQNTSQGEAVVLVGMAVVYYLLLRSVRVLAVSVAVSALGLSRRA